MCSQNSGSLLGERPTEGSLKEGAGCLPGTAVINTERTKGNVLVTCPFAVTKAKERLYSSSRVQSTMVGKS